MHVYFMICTSRSSLLRAVVNVCEFNPVSALPNLPTIDLPTVGASGPASATPAPWVVLGQESSLGPAPGPQIATAPGTASDTANSGTGTGCDACELVSNAGEVGCAGDYTVASNVDECPTGGTICEGFGGAPSVTCCAPDTDILTVAPAGELKMPVSTCCHLNVCTCYLGFSFKFPDICMLSLAANEPVEASLHIAALA